MWRAFFVKFVETVSETCLSYEFKRESSVPMNKVNLYKGKLEEIKSNQHCYIPPSARSRSFEEKFLPSMIAGSVRRSDKTLLNWDQPYDRLARTWTLVIVNSGSEIG